MLKLRIISVAMMTGYLAIFGCGGGGSTINLDSQARTSLVGTWRLARGGQPGSPTVTCPGLVNIGGTPLACTDNTTITFNPNGTFQAFEGAAAGTWTVTSGDFTANSGQYSFSGELDFDNNDTVTVNDSQGHFLTFVRVG